MLMIEEKNDENLSQKVNLKITKFMKIDKGERLLSLLYTIPYHLAITHRGTTN